MWLLELMLLFVVVTSDEYLILKRNKIKIYMKVGRYQPWNEPTQPTKTVKRTNHHVNTRSVSELYEHYSLGCIHVYNI